MLLLTIAALSLLACINYRFAKSFFYPGAVFCASWAGTLFLLWLAGDFFYPLSPETLFIVLCGGFALSLGSALPFLRQFPGLPINPGPFPRPSRRILNWLVFVVLCGAPLALGWIIHLASQRQAGFFGAISFSLTDETTQDTIGYKLFGNLELLALTGALIAFYERESGKKQAIVAM